MISSSRRGHGKRCEKRLPTALYVAAELLEDLPPNRSPAPFREIEHDFPTLEDLCSWLGNPQVKANRRESEPLQGQFFAAWRARNSGLVY